MGVQSVSAGRLSLEANIIREQPLFWRLIRALERLIACVLLLAAFPGLVLVAVVVMVLSRRSPLIAHRRVGHGGRDIWVLKLRTMWPTARAGGRFLPLVEKVNGDTISDIKSWSDPRVSSRFAAFCRRYSIDECPQLWQVITGEMALVGPRPLMAEEIETFYGARASELLSVKPGITGLWQIKGRSRLRRPQRTRLDLFMIHHWSMTLYLQILWTTVPSVLAGKDAW
ncbi:MAG TPA: sugar transferase [Bryobacteraceae bacterium]|nr:sugar transferase [Bryobacteraceae bacterium]